MTSLRERNRNVSDSTSKSTGDKRQIMSLIRDKAVAMSEGVSDKKKEPNRTECDSISFSS